MKEKKKKKKKKKREHQQYYCKAIRVLFQKQNKGKVRDTLLFRKRTAGKFLQ